MSTFAIPKGKIVRIFQNGINILDNEYVAPGVQLFLDEPVTFNISSNFTPFFDDTGNKLLNTIGAVFRDLNVGQGFSSQSKFFGFQIWNNSEPIVMDLNFKFYRGMTKAFSGRTEVVNPINLLGRLPLPSEPTNSSSLSTLIPPGPSVLSLIKGDDESLVRGLRTDILIGEHFRFNNVIVKKGQPTFSEDVDEENYPIEGKIALEVTTVFNATKQMLSLYGEQAIPEGD